MPRCHLHWHLRSLPVLLGFCGSPKHQTAFGSQRVLQHRPRLVPHTLNLRFYLRRHPCNKVCELYGQCKDLARLGVAQFASSKLAQRYGSRIAARGLARASPPPFPTLAVGHERVACNGALSVIALNIRTILRGLMVLKLLACADEGAGTRRVESQATSGSARPFAGKPRGRCWYRPHLCQPAGARPRKPDNHGSRTACGSSRRRDRRVLRRPGCGRASAEASARWSTTKTIEGATQGNYAKQLWVFARGVRHQSAPPPPRKAALAG
jgi:hypothetical protein